jgi:hypothetical protein
VRVVAPIDAPTVRVLQPADLFRWADVKHTDETEKVLALALAFLVSMSPGDALELSMATFHKIADDLVQIDVHVKAEVVADALVKRRVIKLPL